MKSISRRVRHAIKHVYGQPSRAAVAKELRALRNSFKLRGKNLPKGY